MVIGEAIDVAQTMPRRLDEAGEKRDFSLKLAGMVAKMEVSPRFRKMAQDYVKLREKQAGSAEKKKEIKDRFEQAEGEAMERARQESEELQRARALARGPPSPKRTAGRKKLNLTEEEKINRAKQQRKAAYERSKQKKKALTQGEVDAPDGAEGSSGERDWQGRQLVMVEEGGGNSLVAYEEEGPGKKRRKIGPPQEETDTESSLEN